MDMAMFGTRLTTRDLPSLVTLMQYAWLMCSFLWSFWLRTSKISVLTSFGHAVNTRNMASASQAVTFIFSLVLDPNWIYHAAATTDATPSQP